MNNFIAVSSVGVVPTRTVGASASIIFRCSTKIQKNDFFWYRPTWVVPDQRLINGCVRARACVLVRYISQ